jgi:hypothetical protein
VGRFHTLSRIGHEQLLCHSTVADFKGLVFPAFELQQLLWNGIAVMRDVSPAKGAGGFKAQSQGASP